ncbi:MAG TPA: RagB/SusD family nutrient uptake outer membrane protein [Cyclobacteriaceae bacterium]|nr:RagB/SusD family nutrient uptake outer membrane protein [Cyclobacteriaceae bacterium]
MKTNSNKISVITTLFTVMMMSCVGDLDVTPIDPNITTSANVYTDTESYKAGLAKLYAAFALTGQQGPAGNGDVGGVDEGFSDFIRSLWNLNELTTDEAVWTYPNDAQGTIFNLHYNTWVPSDGIPTALFARIMNVAALTNEFIRATEGKLDDPDIKKFHAEARFLRALSYYYGLDLFANMPFVTEKDLPGAYFPEQISRAELFAYVESELKAIKPDMGAPRFEYGRADQGACAMLLAKLYLNAEVYLGAGQAKYTEALTELKEVIEGGYSLSPKYAYNFLADNNTSPEIIFAQLFDGQKSQAYDALNVMIYGNAGNGGWSGLRTTSAFVNKFTNPNEARAIFAKEDKGQSLEIDAVNNSKQGYGVYKFQNVTSTGAPGSHPSFQDTDFPMFRLADAYLMYAEAVLRGGSGGDATTALGYVNAIRTRPGDVTAGNAPGAITSGQLTLDFILDERARELYWEAHRRVDLIRFGKYTGDAYLWPWKGGDKDGKSIGAERAIFPIPAADLGSNPNLEQNVGY